MPFLRSFTHVAGRFREDRSGNVAILFALTCLPVAFMAGAAVDYSRASAVLVRAQNAVDVAALALAKDPKMSASDTDTLAANVFSANFSGDPSTTVLSLKAERDGKKVKVTVSAKVRNAFASILPVPEMQIGATSTAESAGKPVEIALVLDNTGSMRDAGKMEALRKSAKNLVDFLDASVTSRDQAKVALVPFATQVNIGTSVKSATWLTYDSSGSTVGSKMSSSNWKGCVTDRNKPHNTALPDASISGSSAYWADVCDVSNLSVAMPLSTDYFGIKRAIDDMTAGGNTNIGIGMAWGMEALVPGGPMDTKTPLGSKDVDKIVILLTDGLNTEDRFDRPSCFLIFCTPANVTNLNARTLANCSAAKAAGIRVYTVRLVEGDEGLLRACASESSFFYDVLNPADLEPAFKSIGGNIMAVRISK